MSQIINKRDDVIKQKHIQTVQMDKKEKAVQQAPPDEDNVVMKALQTEKDRLIY